jgi:hypothetical protein
MKALKNFMLFFPTTRANSLIAKYSLFNDANGNRQGLEEFLKNIFG